MPLRAEITSTKRSGWHIHQQGAVFQFKEEENPRARLMATARNDRQFVDGRDLQRLAKEIRYVFSGGDQVAKAWRIVALPCDWDSDPWSKLEPNEQPSEWKDGRLPDLVLPELPDNLNAKLGMWLKTHLAERRNIPRYLLPRGEDGNIFRDPNLVVLARAVMTAAIWRNDKSLLVRSRLVRNTWVTRDKDLLSVGEYERVAMIEPEAFLHVLRGEPIA